MAAQQLGHRTVLLSEHSSRAAPRRKAHHLIRSKCWLLPHQTCAGRRTPPQPCPHLVSRHSSLCQQRASPRLSPTASHSQRHAEASTHTDEQASSTGREQDSDAETDEETTSLPLDTQPLATQTQQTEQQSKRPDPLHRLLAALGTIARALLKWTVEHWPRQARGRRLLAAGFLMTVGCVSMFSASLGSRAVPVVRASQEVVYSEFLTLVNAGSVRAARIDETAERIYFDLRHGYAHPHQHRQQHQPALSQPPVQQLAQQLPPAAAAAAVDSAAPDASPTAAVVDADTTVAGSSSAGQQPAPALPVPMVIGAAAKVQKQFYTKRMQDPLLIPVLMTAGVEFGVIKATLMSGVARAVATALALWLPLMPLFFIMRNALNGRAGNRKKRGSTAGAAQSVTFRDVAGVDSAKEELREVVACLKDSQRYARLRAKMPSGVLLCGSPGTGKTMLARAVAGEAGVPFFAASASEFVELFVGRGAARIRDLFAEARKKAPCVVFIDELDAVGGKRGLGLNEERDQTLNQLLTELDGFEGRPGVLLLAATNRPEVLDPALTRPGRLSRKVVVPLPDEAGRAAILAVHLRDTPMASPQDKHFACSYIARLTGGFSGAELANVANEAALLAGRQGKDAVEMGELVEAVQRTKYGVNGGGPSILAGLGWQRKLQNWVVDAATKNQRVRASPLGS